MSEKYIPWQNAGGPNECAHGYAASIPCPDCKTTLAALRAKWEAAKVPKLFAQKPSRCFFPELDIYEVDTGGERHWFALCQTKERAEAIEFILNAFPAICEHIEGLEKERDALLAQVAELRKTGSAMLPIAMPVARRQEVDPLYGPGPKWFPESVLIESEKLMAFYATLSNTTAASLEAHDRQVKAEALKDLDESLKWIFGLMPWHSRDYAILLRAQGREIPHKCEEEQAAAMHWLVNLYLQHGPDQWREVGGKIIGQYLDEKKKAEAERLEAAAAKESPDARP